MTKVIKVARIFLVLILILSFGTLAACQQSSSSESTWSQVSKVARNDIWKDINSGAACAADVAVLDNGQIVYSDSFGVADRDTGALVDETTLFNMGSTSKTYVSAAVMLLVDQGKVKLDNPVVQYLPEFKMADPRYKNITVRMILDHQCALPGTTTANNVGYAINPNFYADTLAAWAHSHLKTDPGMTAPYCNDGFTLAEMLVAKVSGQKYIDFLTDKILKPLGLTQTGVSVGARPPDTAIARFYQPDTGKAVPPEALSVLGAGGLSSTAEELVKFGDSFSPNGKHVLTQASLNEMMKAQQSTLAKDTIKQMGFSPEFSYGLGLDYTDVPAYQKKGIKVVGKGGDTDDYHSVLLSVPSKRISVAVMEAGHGGNCETIGFDVLNSVLETRNLMKKDTPAVTSPPAPQPIPASYQAYAGYYDMGSSVATVSFDFDNNVLLFTKAGGAPADLTYRDGYFYNALGRQFGFMNVDGQRCILLFVEGLGITAGQIIPTAAKPQKLRIDLNGATWLRRNVRPWEAISLSSGHLLASSTNTALPGFVIMTGSHLVESPVYAGMTSAALRDLTEIDLLDKGGQTWTQLSEMTYSPTSVAVPLGTGEKSATIGRDGYNEWMTTKADLVLGFNKPAKDRVIVFGPDTTPIYDSVIDSGQVFAPAGSFVELAGASGDTLKVTATTPKG
jgi:CubicO group peptidase (beta-lactamase class C family)